MTHTSSTGNNDNSNDSYANLTAVVGLDVGVGGDFSATVATTATVHTSAALPATALYLTEAGDTSAISVNDVHQDGIGDCFLISSIGELALNDPAAISNMIHVNANGTETVTLYEGTINPLWGATTNAGLKAVQENVTNTFAFNSVNSIGNQDVVNGQKEIWPQVIEKAFSQLYGGYNVLNNGGNPALALEELTGKVAQMQSPSSLTLASLMADVSAHDLIVMDTAHTNNLPNGLVGGHAYMFEGVTGTGSGAMVHLGNPWGIDQPTPIAFSQLSKGITEVDVGHFS